MASFGRDPKQETINFDRLVLESPVVRPVTAEIMARKAYQQDYGICDHDNDDPWDRMILHDKENYIEGGPRRTLQRKYFNYKMRDRIGLSITEFMKLPYADAMFFLEIAESEVLQEAEIAAKVHRDMNKN